MYESQIYLRAVYQLAQEIRKKENTPCTDEQKLTLQAYNWIPN